MNNVRNQWIVHASLKMRSHDLLIAPWKVLQRTVLQFSQGHYELYCLCCFFCAVHSLNILAVWCHHRNEDTKSSACPWEPSVQWHAGFLDFKHWEMSCHTPELLVRIVQFKLLIFHYPLFCRLVFTFVDKLPTWAVFFRRRTTEGAFQITTGLKMKR